MFKKPKRNIRRRDQSDENDEDSAMDVDEAKEDEKPKSRPKPQHQPPKKTTAILSFAEEFEEEEEEVFQVKKSSQSRKFRRQAGKDKEEKEKDKEQRRKKKDEENGVENSFPNRKNEKIVTTNEVTLKIKNPIAGPIKSSSSYQPILNGREAEAAEVGGISSEEEEEERGRGRGSKKKSGGHAFSKPPEHVMKDILKSGAIPDAAMIHAARKRRQKARELGDYVQISEKTPQAQTQPISVDQNKRLVHEDDDQDGSESEEERVDMSNINMAAVDRKNRQDAYDSVQRLRNEESDSDKDGEDDAWEKQQIRKGVTGTQLSTAQADSSLFITATGGSYHIPFAPSTHPSSQHPPLPPAPLPSSLPSSILSSLATQSNICTPGEIVSSLKTRLTSLKETYRRHTLDKQSLLDELGTIRQDSETLKENGPKLATRFRFYQDMRGYVTDLVECLDEKIPVLVGLEQRILALVERQANGLIARRRQDVKDQAEEMSPANISNKILGLGNARNLSEELTRRIAEREGRRIRRMRAREKGNSGGGVGQQPPHIEGMSSDEEVTEAESSAFRLQRETIESDARIVFEDVNDEFSLVECVVAKFARWKTFEPDQYGDAYVSLCLTKILGPFVRFKLLFWNPLTQPLKSLEEERWYRSLLLYGLTSSETEESLVRDPDVMLLPKVVEKVILTKIEVIVKAAYNPLSTSQTVCLIGTLSKLLQDFPTLDGDCKILNCVLEATVDRLRKAVDDDVFIPIYMNDVESGRTSLFFQRQFASAIKLLGNIVRWQGLLSNEIVIQIGIDSLLNRYLILGLRTFTDPLVAAEKCKMISSVLPRSWLNVNSGVSQLEMFIRQVRQITEKLKNASS